MRNGIAVKKRETDTQKEKVITVAKRKDALLDISIDLDDARFLLDKASWIKNVLIDLVEPVGKDDFERRNIFMGNKEDIGTATAILADYLLELGKALDTLSDKIESARKDT